MVRKNRRVLSEYRQRKDLETTLPLYRQIGTVSGSNWKSLVVIGRASKKLKKFCGLNCAICDTKEKNSTSRREFGAS